MTKIIGRGSVIQPSQKTGSDIEAPTIRRRWFADNVSELLLYRLLERIDAPRVEFVPNLVGGSSSNPPRVWAWILCYFRDSGLEKDQKPASLSQLLTWAKVGIAIKLPPGLTHYASGRHTGVSLPPEVWTRVRTGRAIAVSGDGSDEYASSESSYSLQQMRCLSKVASLKYQEKLLTQFRHTLQVIGPDGRRQPATSASKVIPAAKQFLQDNEIEMYPLLYHLVQWSIYLLSGSRKASSHHARLVLPSSVLTYLSVIGPFLLAEAGDAECINMTEDGFEELYEGALERKKEDRERDFKLSWFPDATIRRSPRYGV
jgi:hypothetical protein